ncbi:hypothetical protein E5288_WYG004819 [Bos mutus]|uniref:Uncharacterized protein n=1 Tax=Bos mutus TaxID=72004 RepID=A0A6B0QWU1_9CETA|nr:hypothetical protein [Bos mutus]
MTIDLLQLQESAVWSRGGGPAPQHVTEAPLSPGPLASFIFVSRPEEHQDKRRKLEHERALFSPPVSVILNYLRFLYPELLFPTSVRLSAHLVSVTGMTGLPFTQKLHEADSDPLP